MRPPSRPDEDNPRKKSNKVSITRYDYAGIEFCREHARNHQSDSNRHYWGFARFVVNRLVEPWGDNDLSCVVKSKPSSDNPTHANIEYGFWSEKGVTAESQVTEYLKQLVARAEIYEDPNPTSVTWEGGHVDETRNRELKYKKRSRGLKMG